MSTSLPRQTSTISNGTSIEPYGGLGLEAGGNTNSVDESELGGGLPPRVKLELDDGLLGDPGGTPLVELLLAVDGSLELDEPAELANDAKGDSTPVVALEGGTQPGRAEPAAWSLLLEIGGMPLKLADKLPEFATTPLALCAAWPAVAAVGACVRPADGDCDGEPIAPATEDMFSGRGGSEPAALEAEFGSPPPSALTSTGGGTRFRGPAPVAGLERPLPWPPVDAALLPSASSPEFCCGRTQPGADAIEPVPLPVRFTGPISPIGPVAALPFAPPSAEGDAGEPVDLVAVAFAVPEPKPIPGD
jgi:hypothetical protein